MKMSSRLWLFGLDVPSWNSDIKLLAFLHTSWCTLLAILDFRSICDFFEMKENLLMLCCEIWVVKVV